MQAVSRDLNVLGVVLVVFVHKVEGKHVIYAALHPPHHLQDEVLSIIIPVPIPGFACRRLCKKEVMILPR
jgi:hypothetical protein